MRPGRLVYRLAQVYAALLVVAWLAVGGFGLLLLTALLMAVGSR